jgi:tRNA-dihydrouridine synthase A
MNDSIEDNPNGLPHGSEKLLCVAPMMAWTDRHCRNLHRLYTPSALLFTEMVTTGALLHGQQWQLLDYAEAEHPLALQLGGNAPRDLAACTREAQARGYDEVNLNVGCPSDRVQQGTFGACLMMQPQLVADCISAMQDAGDVRVSVKCRLGVDAHDSDELLQAFVETVAASGCERFYIHARKAILGGLTPAQNRSIPPLQPWRAKNLKAQLPHLEIILNGGITDADQAQEHLAWADGVMIGRAAYHQPMLLAELERRMFHPQHQAVTLDILSRYLGYMQHELQQGTRLSAMTRHLLHCCNGMPGARRFRRVLSDSKRLKRNDLAVVHEAIHQVFAEAA